MSSTVLAYVALGGAIVSEVVGTAFLARSEEFTRAAPTLLMTLFYVVSFYLLTLSLRAIPLGIAYAIWGGLGVVLIALVGVFGFGQRLDPAAIVGIAMIVGGVVVLNTFSDSASL